MYDCNTHYVGKYISDNEILITGVSGSGDPYILFGGFDQFYEGKEVVVTSDNANIGFTSKNFKIYKNTGGCTFYNFDGSYLPPPIYSVLLNDREVKNGIYNISIKFNGITEKFKITVNK